MIRLKKLLLNISFYPLFFISSAVLIPVFAVYVSVVRIVSSRREAVRSVRRAVGWYGNAVLSLASPLVKIECHDIGGADSGGACLYVCNHRSLSDPFLMACLHRLVPSLEVIQLAKRWPLRLPVLGQMARVAGYFSVNEMELDEFYRRAGAYLADGVSIISFPEGTRSGGRELGPFHSLVFRLALKEKAPIVPVCIAGNENIPPRNSLLLQPGKIILHKLSAIQPTDFEGMEAFKLKNMIWRLMADELERMDEGRSGE